MKKCDNPHFETNFFHFNGGKIGNAFNPQKGWLAVGEYGNNEGEDIPLLSASCVTMAELKEQAEYLKSCIDNAVKNAQGKTSMSPDELNIDLTAKATVWLAKATFVLAFFTAVAAILTGSVAWFTKKLARESKESSRQQLGVQTWLEMQKRFDSKEMINARKTLVAKMKDYRKSDHHKISETVFNFFEDVGILYKKGFIDQDLTDSSFSFYACRWYEICKPYIDTEQKRHGEDETFFEYFGYLSDKLRQLRPDDVIDDAELKSFLDDESRLVAD